jgi:hypothetical protein
MLGVISILLGDVVDGSPFPPQPVGVGVQHLFLYALSTYHLISDLRAPCASLLLLLLLFGVREARLTLLLNWGLTWWHPPQPPMFTC